MLRGVSPVFYGRLCGVVLDRRATCRTIQVVTSQRLPCGKFQRPFELLKASYPDMTYAHIWHAYYLILSALDGISCGAPVFRAVSDR